MSKKPRKKKNRRQISRSRSKKKPAEHTNTTGKTKSIPPPPSSAFQGREAELNLFRELVSDKERKLVILGMPGAGKTTFLSQIAKRLASGKLDEKDKEVNKQLLSRIESIPLEVFEERPATIIDLYREYLEAEQVGQQPLHEVKMLVVGQGGVGKTQIANLLLGKSFNDMEPNTEGINIHAWSLRTNKKEIKVNIWDFGGQEIMHSTHQFFLTKRSLYLLVWDARQEDRYGQIEYWLKLIQSFGTNSPIILVLNKVDVGNIELDRRELQQKYPSIKQFVNISCKTGQNFDILREAINSEVAQMQHLDEVLPKNWFDVKNELERMPADFIEYSKYQAICEELGIDEKGQRLLVSLLHDLGVVLNFQDDPRLRFTQILKPEWVTQAVYRIINHPEIRQSKGILKLDRLDNILPRERYPAHKHMVIIDTMKRFELCFEFLDQVDTFLIPGLLPIEAPNLASSYQDGLAFQYHYSFFPMSIISRFIVRTHSMIFQTFYWRNGVVLADKHNQALIKADRDERKVYIWVQGQINTRRDFLAKIRNEFENIHATFFGIEVKEKVPLPNDPTVIVDYQHLLDLEEMGEETFIPYGLKQKVEIKNLLAGLRPSGKENMNKSNKTKILFLGANPSGPRLKLDEEVKRIHTNLKLAKARDNLELVQEWAVTIDTLIQAFLDESPTIIHFSGHGQYEGIILQDEVGEPKVVTTEALANLFRLFRDTIECVVLNSCYSEVQAQAIRSYIPFVIGMRAGIPDSTAIAFSVGFYKAIGAGKDIPFAFELGKAAIQLSEKTGDNIPLLL